MVQAKELRIGNAVLHEGIAKQITGVVNGSQIGAVYFNTTTNESAGTHMLNPIPLTPEVLEKVGFVNECPDVWPGVWQQDGYKVVEPHDVSGKWYFYLGTKYSQFESLHQLQNLYFALTGEELPIEF